MSEPHFISDTHFWHKNIIAYCNRKNKDGKLFSTVEEMNEELVENWNKVVSPYDTVYHLGDFAFGNLKKACSILERLNGRKFLVTGNHDYFIKKPEFRKHFEWIRHYYEMKVYDKDLDGHRRIVMSHYPMVTWNHAHHGSWHLHGHCHGGINDINQETTRHDVGVDVNNFRPVSYADLKKIFASKTYKKVDHHDGDYDL
jgi:calcineurin-like phosphoesterase family protein